MPKFLKKITLILFALSLLSSFQASASVDSYQEKSALIDTSTDQNNSEDENCELENSKFLQNFSNGLQILEISLLIKNKQSAALKQNFAIVPTSPPNS
jgi:hypothetical protein